MNRVVRCLFCGLFLVNSPAYAGLFSDDDARKQIQQLEARIVLVEKLEQRIADSEEHNKVAVRSMLDLQTQLEVQATELRKLRGQNEELIHSLQDAEKRQKDFYIDLDARIRQLESGSVAVHTNPTNPVDGSKDVSSNPVGENKAFETAYSFYKVENYQNAAIAFRDFLLQFPQSVHEANVYYWMGNAYFLSRDYANSLDGYRNLLGKYPDHPRAPEAMLNVAECQLELKSKAAAKTTLKQLISQFPGSDAADKAKKRLATLK
ncbi:MAG: tol-pal system protein YbgF [Pseudomonadota bacterium]